MLWTWACAPAAIAAVADADRRAVFQHLLAGGDRAPGDLVAERNVGGRSTVPPSKRTSRRRGAAPRRRARCRAGRAGAGGGRCSSFRKVYTGDRRAATGIPGTGIPGAAADGPAPAATERHLSRKWRLWRAAMQWNIESGGPRSWGRTQMGSGLEAGPFYLSAFLRPSFGRSRPRALRRSRTLKATRWLLRRTDATGRS